MNQLLFAVIGSVCLGAIACSSSDNAAGPSGGTGGADSGSSSGGKTGGGSGGKAGAGGSAGSGGSAGDASAGITISGITHEWAQEDPFSTPPLAGVKVCVRSHPEIACSTSGTDGAFAVHGVPENSKVQVTFEKSDRVSQLRAVKTETADIAMPAFENALAQPADTATVLPNTTVDFKKGSILFFISSPGTRFQNGFDWLRGFTVSISPKSGEGPLYLDTHSVHDATATSSVGGYGFFENMADGDYTVTFTVPAGIECVPWKTLGLNDIYGYPTTDPLKVDVPIVGGYYTGPTGLYCRPATDGGTDSGAADSGSATDSGRD